MSSSCDATMSFGSDLSTVRGKSPVPSQASSDDGDLFSLLGNKKIAIEPSLVETYFFDIYTKNPEEGVALMFQLLIDMSDDWYDFRITSEMVASMSSTEILYQLEDLEENMSNTGQDSARPPLAKHTFDNYTKFVELMFLEFIKTGHVYEQKFFTQLINFLGAMSLMEFECLRKIALSTGIQLNTILISETVKLKEQKRNTERLLNIVSSHPQTKDTVLIRNRLNERLKEVEPKVRCLENLLDQFYDINYVKTNLSWDSSVRLSSCAVVAVSTWMLMYPEKYVTFDALVNTFGYFLCDGTALLRFEVLKALVKLYASAEVRAGLGLFTQHYVRFVVDNAMATGNYPEVTERVGMKAIALLRDISYHFESCVHEDYDRRIFTLLYNNAEEISYEAGEYLQIRLMRRYGRCYAEVIQHVIRWIVTSPSAKAMEPLLENMVDSLINSGEIFRDWDCITKMLLRKCRDLTTQMDSSEQIILLQILVHAVTLIYTGQKSSYRKKSKAKQPEANESDLHTKSKLKAYFVPVVRMLMSEFAQVKKAVELIKVLATTLEIMVEIGE